MDSEHDTKETSTEKSVKGKRPNVKGRVYTTVKTATDGRTYQDFIGWIEFPIKEDDE